MKTCCICKKKFTEYGNDPWPVMMNEKALCCDSCDINIVLPARLVDYYIEKHLNELKDMEKRRAKA